jgi:hypothetical protein
MSASVARSERILNSIAAKTGLTDAAVEYLKTTLDPFHDNPLNCTGIPDSETGQSVVQCIKNSVTIGCPSGITTGTWDCHVQMEPFFANSATPLFFANTSSIDGANVGNLLAYDTENNTLNRPVYPVNILAYPTGETPAFSSPFIAAVSDSSHVATPMQLNAKYTDGDYRIVSQGFEVINTTSELNIQGLCTCYRTPVPDLEAATTANVVATKTGGAATVAWGAVSYLPIDSPPITISEALKLPNTKQWKAKEGCYVVAHVNSDCNPVENNNWVNPLVQRLVASNNYDAPRPTAVAAAAATYLSFREVSWAPMDISGSFFTGLSLQTTLTINWNIYIERFPSKLQDDLVVLAKPSPAYCPMVFEVYKAIAQNLPVGVPQKENGLGDWFRDAVATISDVVTPVMSMIPHPYAQAGAALSKGIGGMVRRESASPYQPSGEPAKQVRQEIKAEAKKEIKEIKKEIVKHPFLKKSKMSVMPSAKKAHKK